MAYNVFGGTLNIAQPNSTVICAGLDGAAVPGPAGICRHDGHCGTPGTRTLQQWIRGGRWYSRGGRGGRRRTAVCKTTDVNP